jgi:hypothetical protein
MIQLLGYRIYILRNKGVPFKEPTPSAQIKWYRALADDQIAR